MARMTNEHNQRHSDFFYANANRQRYPGEDPASLSRASMPPGSHHHRRRHDNHHHDSSSSSSFQSSWNVRDGQNQQSSLLGNAKPEPMSPYNATPLSWFQRYYYYHNRGATIDRAYHRHQDDFYTSSGTIPDLMQDGLDDDNREVSQPPVLCSTCCETLCGALCRMLCCGCCCTRQQKQQYETIATMAQNGEIVSPQQHQQRTTSSSSSFSRYKASSGFCLVFVLTIFLPAFLLHASRGDFTWTLHRGESHRIQPAFLNHAVTVATSPLRNAHATDDKDKDFSVQVYAVPGTCPPLTGPPRRLVTRDKNLVLAPNNLAYHSFYLQEGSNVTANIASSAGTFNVYFLQGSPFSRQLERLSFDPSDNLNALKKTTVPPGQVVQWNETINTTDAYIMLYDNPNQGNVSLSVSYDFELSSYNLGSKRPTCSLAGAEVCTVPVPILPTWQKQCFLVQATTSASDDDDQVDLDSVAIIHTTQHRRFGWIVMISLLPLFVYSLLPSCYREEEEGHQQQHARSYDELYHAVFPQTVLHDSPHGSPTSILYPSSNVGTPAMDEEARAYIPNLPISNSEALSSPSYQRAVVK